MEYKDNLQQMQEDFEQHKAQKPSVTSGYVAPLNPAPPYYPPYKHPCPSCGRCPHCGRGGYGWTPYSGPQWTLTSVTAAAPGNTFFPTSN